MMMRLRIGAVCVLAGVLAGCAPETEVEEPVAEREAASGPPALVSASVHTDAASIAPGGTFRVGVRLAPAPGTHVYWRNPGDSGLPTGIEWEMPEGFAAGELAWPVPVRFVVEEINDISYGYADEVFLYATLTAPATAAPGEEVAITVSPYWLACMDDGQCIPGGVDLSLSLAVGEPAKGPEEAMFDSAEAALPGSPGDAAEQLTVEEDGEGLVLSAAGPWGILVAPQASAYPFGEGHWDVVDPGSVDSAETVRRIRFEGGVSPFSGVVDVHLLNADTGERVHTSIQIGEFPEV